MKLRPRQGEYNPFYEMYIGLVPEGELLTILQAQHQTVLGWLESLSEEQWEHRYAPDKWSVKQVVGHISDNERIMAYRLLCIARGETGPLPGYDQDIYVPGASFDGLATAYLLEELRLVRHSTLSLLAGLNDEAWQRQGNVNGGPMTPLALACIIIGHELHHLNVLKERYIE
ncbi:DinB family protein [Paenibacillus rigui]|uniref:Squalene--hopene cyclase n=1 Tax=Paenibacillus rigui TaxID=554312 RepID=A0A229UHA7_9BACL|nr:DinB family protein [Paenibacillus rigui]OXM82773.1 squalene--hopene cyclase [Paenibacillus rigui]